MKRTLNKIAREKERQAASQKRTAKHVRTLAKKAPARKPAAGGGPKSPRQTQKRTNGASKAAKTMRRRVRMRNR